ncbi:MAG TPA: DNA-binding response regulator [Bacteroidetes bacterium]|nr:DNA-binding response regulator [Bacteroidota bacterium]
MTEKIKLMIADDHQMFSDGLVSIFQNDDDIQIVGIAANGIELMRLLEQKEADLVLMDLSMPQMNGEEASKEILSLYPEMKIIVLTMHHTPDIVLPLVDSGVHGFMLKNSGKSELKTAIAQVMDGDGYFSAEIIRMLTNRKKVQTDEVVLTRREKEILELIYKGMPTAEIAEKLFISPYTVETHRRNLLSKTDTRNATQLINKAIEKGWIKVGTRL